MDRCEIERCFALKIGLELSKFKKKVLKQNPEEIFARAYQIDCMINIYEFLLEMSREIEEERLKLMLAFPNLLAFLYFKWIKQDSSFEEELKSCMNGAIEEINDVYCKQMQEVKVA